MNQIIFPLSGPRNHTRSAQLGKQARMGNAPVNPGGKLPAGAPERQQTPNETNCSDELP